VRKRYSVVVRGVSGTVRDQTSEISRHRSEAAAREAAETERHRLFVVRPEAALNYRIAIYRDDRELILDEPALTGDTAPLPQGPERDLSSLTGRPAPAGPADAEVLPPGAGGEEDDTGRAPLPAADEGDTGRVPAPAAEDEGDTGRAAVPAHADGNGDGNGDGPSPPRRRLADEPLPEGPVPEDVIARFAQSLEREERRRGRRS
jgi:hypothetical protein